MLCCLTGLVWGVTFWFLLGPVSVGDPRGTAYEVLVFRGNQDLAARWFHYTGFILIKRHRGFEPVNARNEDVFEFTNWSAGPGVMVYHHYGVRRFGEELLVGRADWVVVRTALVFLVFLPLALVAVAEIRRAARTRLRRRRGLCVACAYDLRADVSGVCPECGEQVVSAGSGVG